MAGYSRTLPYLLESACDLARPEGAYTYQPRAERSAALGKDPPPGDEALKGRNDTQTRVPQSLAKNLVHLVYSTRYRKPWSPSTGSMPTRRRYSNDRKVVSPLQGLVCVIMITQGGAALSPGLICSSPFGACEPAWLGIESTSPETAGYSREPLRDERIAEFKRHLHSAEQLRSIK